MRFLTDLIEGFLLDLVGSSLKKAFRPVADYMRRISAGVVILIVSSVAWIASLVFLLLTLFFALSDYHNLALPAFWTGLASIIVGTIMVLIGLRLVRRPR